MKIYRVAYYKDIETPENSAVSLEDEAEYLPAVEEFFDDYDKAINFYRRNKISPTASKLHYVETVYRFDSKCLEAADFDEEDLEEGDSLSDMFYKGYNYDYIRYDISAPYGTEEGENCGI